MDRTTWLLDGDDLPAGTQDVLTLDLAWVTRPVDLAGESWVGLVPMITAIEYRVSGSRWDPVRTWDTLGSVALYAMRSRPDDVFTLPQIALEEAVVRALEPLPRARVLPVRQVALVPVVIAADDDYRAAYGPTWPQVMRARVDLANELLAPAGIALDVRAWSAWTSPEGVDDMSELLDAFAAELGTPEGLALGVTLRPQLARSWQGELDDIGRAYRPGQHAIVADQAGIPGSDPYWDALGDASALAHEVLHTLGVPHQAASNALMSPRRQWLTTHVDRSSAELARIATLARFYEPDQQRATDALARTAEAFLADPDAQVQYVTQNAERARPAATAP